MKSRLLEWCILWMAIISSLFNSYDGNIEAAIAWGICAIYVHLLLKEIYDITLDNNTYKQNNNETEIN